MISTIIVLHKMWGCRGRSIQGTAKVWGSCEGWRIKQCHKMVLWQLCKNCGEGNWKVAAAGTGSGETDGCGIQESEDMDEKVGLIIKELGFSKQYRVIGRIGWGRKGLRRAIMQTLVGIDLWVWCWSQWQSSEEWFLYLENSRVQKTLRTFLFHQI